jgi:two-component system, LuxR family, response regulator DctR
MIPTVLVVDDEPDVRDAVAFALRQSGHAVRSFASGPELLAEIDAQLPELRAVCVLDVRMEPMSGPAVHDALIARGLKQRVPVLFLSGHGDIPTAHAAGSKGAVDFIEKPHIDGLVEKVGLALAQEAQWFAAHSRAVFRRSLWDSLSPQQRRVALRVAEGMLNKQAAHELQVTERMVEEHRRRVYEKLGVDSSAGVATTLMELRADGVALD